MINTDTKNLETRYRQYWNRENETPLIRITAPKDGAVRESAPKAPDSLAERWLDTEYVIKKTRHYFNKTAYIGEAFPMCYANFGPDILGAMLGCGLEFGERTSWAQKCASEIIELSPIAFDEQNIWFRRAYEMTEALLKDSAGDYAVGNNDYHTGLDVLVSLIGPEQLCIDMICEPDTVKARLDECRAAYPLIYKKMDDLIMKYQPFRTNWMGHYSENNWSVVECDFSCLVSEDMFREFILPYIIEEVDMLDEAIYHLDGQDAIRHLDMILEIKKLKGVQWVYGAGKPSARHWIPLLQKIQAAGKNIEISVTKDDIKPLLENLEPQGLLMKTRTATETEGRELYRYVTEFRKLRRDAGIK